MEKTVGNKKRLPTHYSKLRQLAELVGDIIFLGMIFAGIWMAGLFGSAEAGTKYSMFYAPNSYHYERNGQNEENHIIGLGINNWSIGTYHNSEFNRSVFVWKSFPLNDYLSISAGGMTGYDAIPIMPMVSINARYKIFFIAVTPVVATAGIRIGLN